MVQPSAKIEEMLSLQNAGKRFGPRILFLEANWLIRAREKTRDDELAKLAAGYPVPRLWKKFETKGFGAGRNVRFGDLDGDGQLDMLIAQNIPRVQGDAFSQISALTASDRGDDVKLSLDAVPDKDRFDLDSRAVALVTEAVSEAAVEEGDAELAAWRKQQERQRR